jgi:hypothetical protein
MVTMIPSHPSPNTAHGGTVIRVVRERLEPERPIALHPPANILRVGMWNGIPTMWVEEDLDDPTNILRTFVLITDYQELPIGRLPKFVGGFNYKNEMYWVYDVEQNHSSST